MKFLNLLAGFYITLSPSMRREWIEMIPKVKKLLPEGSPSMRREWIEIQRICSYERQEMVSLHAEGVD